MSPPTSTSTSFTQQASLFIKPILKPTLSLPSASSSSSSSSSSTTSPTCPMSPTSSTSSQSHIAAHSHTVSSASRSHPQTVDAAPFFILITTYLSYLILIFFGHVRDFFGKWFNSKPTRHLRAHDGYAPLVSDFESFYSRRLYHRIRDCFARPVTRVPGAHLHVLDNNNNNNNKDHSSSSSSTACLNLASYNYLGFAQSHGPCASEVAKTLNAYGINLASPRNEVGSHHIHIQLEKTVAAFIGTEDAMCINMGFATNTTTLPLLVGKGCLIVSDELNHASLVFGARLSGASIEVFKHNTPASLERVLRDAIAQGQPRTHRPWKKILVVVEGLYSMEGHFCPLPAIVALKHKYKFYLFVDEAHSIGAVGASGRGVCELFSVPPSHIDVLMGTFTKSFGAAGGYVAGKKSLISYLKARSHAHVYADPLPFPVAQQVLSALHALQDPATGPPRLQQLRRNAAYFRTALQACGYIVLGHACSPVVPMLIFNPGKLPAFSRLCLAKRVAVVVVGAPATPIVSSRVRFCVSAAHSLEDLRRAVEVVDEIGRVLCLNVGGEGEGRVGRRRRR